MMLLNCFVDTTEASVSNAMNIRIRNQSQSVGIPLLEVLSAL